jgi:subtilisin-like proprotein convertase family protein
MPYAKGFVVGLLLALGLSAQGAVYNSGTISLNNTVLPDGDSNGALFEHAVSSFGSGYTITDVNVGIKLSSDWVGDLYATLTYEPSGGGSGFVVLLNRLGRTTNDQYPGEPAPYEPYYGYGPAVLDITLDHTGAKGDIHTYGGASSVSGSYEPDGRGQNPGLGITSDTRNTSLASAFNGLSANGTWKLFFADVESVSSTTLDSWSLEITAVPEPVTTALMVLGGVFGTFQFVRYVRRRKAPAA